MVSFSKSIDGDQNRGGTQRRSRSVAEKESARVKPHSRRLTEDLREIARHRRDNRRNYFLWKLHFVEVFQAKGGFDVVIGNPPYVRADAGEEHLAMRKAIERRYRSQEQALRVSWRIIKTWVEAQMAIVETKMVTLDQVFLPYVVTDSGQTLYDRLKAANFLLKSGPPNGDHNH